MYEEQYQLYDWITLDLERVPRDFRRESFRPVTVDEPVTVTGHIGTENHWEQRKAIVLKNVYRNLSALIGEAKHEAFYTSLVVFKPARILGFEVTAAEPEWNPGQLAKLREEKPYSHIFEYPEDPLAAMKKLPYQFSFRFTDDKNEEMTLPVEDWQLATLYWQLLKKYSGPGQEQKVIGDIRKKYLHEYARQCDLHFFLGTTQNIHASSRQPFTIVGLFHPTMPPAVVQGSLF